jgi:hypothetical protein
VLTSQQRSLYLSIALGSSLIALYVDDFFIFYNDNVEVENLKRRLQQCFKVKDFGPVTKWLGMEVKRSK